MTPCLRCAVFVTLTTLVGCGDDGMTPDDSGADTGSDVGVVVTPPQIPWLAEPRPPVVLTPCPAGWRESGIDGIVECEPYPESGPSECAAGEAHFPGEPDCRPIGTPCPAGEFASSLPSGAVVFVSAMAAPGGDGSSALPFDSLARVGWSGLAAGTTVLLGKGSYEGTLPLGADVRVIGACAAQTHVLGVSFPAPAVVSVTSAGEPAVIENLTLASAPQRGIDVEAGRSLVVRGVLIDDVHEYGALVLGAGAELTLDDVVIRGTRERDSGTGGRGIQVGEGALIRARRLILDANHDVALIVGLDGTAFISDAAVRDTKARAADGAGGRAINAQGGSRVFVERALLTQNRDVAVTVSEGAEVALTDTIIERTLPTEADLFLGRGIELQSGGQVDATRVVLRDNRTTGVYATGSETSAVLRDVVIRDTQAQAVDGTGGRGINVQDGACVEASQLIVADSREIALFVSDPDSLLVLSDVRIGPTYARVADLTGGRGIAVQAGGRVEATRVAFVDNRDVSVFASDDGSAIMLDDVVIRRTLSDAFDSRRGRGLQAQFGASLLGHRVVIEDAREVGVMAVTGATAELSDLRIERVERTACTTPLCLEAPFGYGLAAGTATVSVTRFLVREAATCGVFLAPDAELAGEPRLDLAEGSVRDSAIGACVQVDGYELGRLTRGVSYEDNGTNLEATTLPVPEPVDSLPE